MDIKKIYDVLIVGAGIAGISAGNNLRSTKISVKILDKGVAVGGRMATKRIDYQGQKVIFDYGCRYLHVEDESFAKALKSFEHHKLAQWNFEENDNQFSKKRKHNLIGRNGIRDIAVQLSNGLNISNNTLVNKVSWTGDHWEIYSSNYSVYKSYSLLLTMPIPQIIDLLNNSKIEIPPDTLSDLLNVEYERKIVGMFILESENQLKNEGGLEFTRGDISFITDNNLKGINKHKSALTVEMSDKFSRDNWSLTEEELFSMIKEKAAEHLRGEIIDFKIHRWKFSRPSKSYGKKYESFEFPGPLFLAGDAFGGSSAESAFISGQHAAISIRKVLQLRKAASIK